tara:strand:+ start:44542 stop:44790 length:249 start_codon:yes stop_codon:yes gene_type:complete
VNKSKSFVAVFQKNLLSLGHHLKRHIMFTFEQYLGFLAFLAILTMGFWLMIFLVSILPYWIGGALYENWKLKREAKRKNEMK